MDRILERYLNRIGFDKDRSEFEGGYFANIVTTKGSNSFKATLVLRRLLNFETYREFFSSIEFFEKDLSNYDKDLLANKKRMYSLAQSFLDLNVTNNTSFASKYINEFLPRVKAYNLFGEFVQWIGIKNCKPIFCETDNRYI